MVRQTATDDDKVRETETKRQEERGSGGAEGERGESVRVGSECRQELPPQDRASLSAPGPCSEARGTVSWESP